MKGIILAGGTGTRLFPSTLGTCKQLLPIYDKPLIYYPLATLMLLGIRDIQLITDEISLGSFKRVLGDGSHLGISISYAIQKKPAGIAEAFLISKDFISGGPCCLILGDNIFYGDAMANTLFPHSTKFSGAKIFGYHVTDPERFGVVEVNSSGDPVSLVEKPQKPVSNYAVTGLYFYDEDVVKIAETIKPSDRGELEITSINQVYLEKGRLTVEILGRGVAWFDAGTSDSLLEASNFVASIQKRTGFPIAALEEIAFRKSWIGIDCFNDACKSNEKSVYGTYLRNAQNP